MSDYRSVCILITLVLLLSGCSIEPQPISRTELDSIALMDRGLIYESQEPIQGPISMTEAMARALKYNLENRVQLMAQVLANKSFELSKMEMLPTMAASAGYVNRSNVNGASSESVESGLESLEPSTSQDRDRRLADIRFAWNILDFGVSYFQAKQDADRYLISTNTRRNIMLKLLQQVRGAFWRAAAMQSLSGDIRDISNRVEAGLNDLEQVRKQQLRTPVSTLYDIRVLVDMLRQLESMQNSVNAAQVELATLINMPPGKDLKLAFPEDLQDPPDIPDDIESLELMALANSPNYASQIYNVRIDQLETRKSLLRLLPGIEFSYGLNYDSNSFLVNNNWADVGIKLTYDLMRIFSIGRVKAYGKASEQLAIARRLALNMAVVAQVHLSWQQYRNIIRLLGHAKRLDAVDREISDLTQQARASQAVNGIELIQNEVRALRSKMEHRLAYTEAQESLGAFLLSLGLNPIPGNYHAMSVQALTESLQSFYNLIDAQ
ncbi:MAG: TolC family protein [Deltaproteobacteria bacterium]|nr:TolC family protein [Deltaproteobacteria bacterium]